tara:strand:- start:800 stop:1027 length:228 start_codon:yes stop_codon:yes gene_type:complete
MDIEINVTNEKIDSITMKKMSFFYNALNEGWTIKKLPGEKKYVFTKNHEGKKQIFMDSYLTEFIKSNMDLSKISD